MNTNNIKTGLIKIPGALTSTGGDGNGLVGGVVAYTGDIYDVALEKNQAAINNNLTEAIDDVNDSISSIQDDISPFTGSVNLQSLVEYDKIKVFKGRYSSQHNEVYINDEKLAMDFGYNNTIPISRKLAFGFGQQLDIPSNTFVIGQRNSYEPNAAFIVGNGTLDGITNNAFVIGRDGNFWVYGINGYTGQYAGASASNSVNDFISDLDTKTTSLQNTINASSTAWSNLAPAANVTLAAITGLNATNAQDAFSEINTVIAPLRTGSISSTLVSDTNFNTTLDQINLSVPYDISAANSSEEYADLETALGSNGENIPQNLRVGGLTVKFVNSDTEEYEQWSLKASSWSTNTSDWGNTNITDASEVKYGNGSVKDALDNAVAKTDGISKEATQSEEDAIIYETDGGVQVGKIDANGADFINLKRGGQQIARMSDLPTVPTLDTSIGSSPSDSHTPSTKAVKDYVDDNIPEVSDYPIETETTSSEDEEVIWCNDANTQEYAKIGSYGMKSKAYLDMQGNNVIPTKDTSIGETPSQTNVPTSKAVAEYVEAHGGGTGDLPIEKTVISSLGEYVVIRNSADTEDVFKVTDEGVRVKSIADMQGNPIGGGEDDTLSGKVVMFIGDSVTASGKTDNPDTSFASFFAQYTGTTVKNHSKGGIGIVEMVDGSGYNPDAQYDPDDYGISYLPPLTAEEVADCDYIVAFGFFNAVNKYEANEPYNYGGVDDTYVSGGTNSVCAQLNRLIDRIYECLATANNQKCKVILATPYKCGHYPYSTGSGYTTYLSFSDYVRKIASHHSLSLLDLMDDFGMNQYTWGIYTNSPNVIRSSYIPYVSETKGNSPFPTIEDLPTTGILNNSYATVGTTSQWNVLKYQNGEWRTMQTGCTPTREYTSIPSGGSHVGGYIWFADQLHPSLECRKQIARYMASKLKNI